MLYEGTCASIHMYFGVLCNSIIDHSHSDRGRASAVSNHWLASCFILFYSSLNVKIPSAFLINAVGSVGVHDAVVRH